MRHQTPRRLDIDREHEIEIRVVGFDHIFRDHDPGIGDNRVDAAEPSLVPARPMCVRCSIVRVIGDDLNPIAIGPVRQLWVAHAQRQPPSCIAEKARNRLTYTPVGS